MKPGRQRAEAAGNSAWKRRLLLGTGLVLCAALIAAAAVVLIPEKVVAAFASAPLRVIGIAPTAKVHKIPAQRFD